MGVEDMPLRKDLETGIGLPDRAGDMVLIHQVIGHNPIVRVLPGGGGVGVGVPGSVHGDVVVIVEEGLEDGEHWFGSRLAGVSVEVAGQDRVVAPQVEVSLHVFLELPGLVFPDQFIIRPRTGLQVDGDDLEILIPRNVDHRPGKVPTQRIVADVFPDAGGHNVPAADNPVGTAVVLKVIIEAGSKGDINPFPSAGEG